jgi:hypothetical protein
MFSGPMSEASGSCFRSSIPSQIVSERIGENGYESVALPG